MHTYIKSTVDVSKMLVNKHLKEKNTYTMCFTSLTTSIKPKIETGIFWVSNQIDLLVDNSAAAVKALFHGA